MFRAGPLSIIRSFSLYTLQTCMTYTTAVCAVKNSCWWTEELYETCRVYSKNEFEKLVHLVGFIIRIYHDARSSERQKETLTLRHQLSFQKGQGHLCRHTQIDPRDHPVDCLNDHQRRKGCCQEWDCAGLPLFPLHTAAVRNLDTETVCKDRRHALVRTVKTCCRVVSGIEVSEVQSAAIFRQYPPDLTLCSRVLFASF